MKIEFTPGPRPTAIITCDSLGDAPPCVGQTFKYNGFMRRILGVTHLNATLAAYPPDPPRYACPSELVTGDDRL